MNIAIYSPNWVGDAALSLPFISNIKLKHPDSKIIILCKKWVSSVYLNHPDIDDLIIIPSGKNNGIVNTLSIGLSLRNLNETQSTGTIQKSLTSLHILKE